MSVTERDLHPIVVLQDRYGGCYSGGRWLAIREADRLENGASRAVRCLEGGPSDVDVEASQFWSDPPPWIAVGQTPDEAVAALLGRTSEQDGQILAELDRKIAEGLADLDAGRVHTADQVRSFLRTRSRRNLDAAE